MHKTTVTQENMGALNKKEDSGRVSHNGVAWECPQTCWKSWERDSGSWAVFSMMRRNQEDEVLGAEKTLT